MRSKLALVILAAVALMLAMLVAEMPRFGNPLNPAFNYVANRYIEKGLEETGALNLVTAIILDYRGFDTFGETTVLFTAILAALVVLAAEKRQE